MLFSPELQPAVASARDTLFRAGEPLVVTRAPGRLDVMGGIADYSGSLVLQLPIREATVAALQRDPEPVLQIVSLGAEANGRSAAFTMPLSDFLDAAGEPVSYHAARRYFGADPRQAWAAYAAGAFLVLMRERGARFPGGARILIASEVPEGKGVSSSAAIEVAVMQAIAAAFEIPLSPRDLALLCQRVENRVVGAPCGVMDQMTSACGEAAHLLALLCQPAEIEGTVAVPEEMELWGIDSGVRHSVSGADYGSVRVGAFMGYRILAEACGFAVERTEQEQLVRVTDPRWHGYLANVTPSELEQHLLRHLPERLTGEEFLARCGGTTDPVTRIDPDRSYAVRVPTCHPVYESHRVRTFAELLRGAPGERRLELLGELMFQSHASYSACGLGSQATDRLVELVRAAGPAAGLYGAKITGGGSGGTVAVLGRRGAEPAVREIAERFAGEAGHRPYLFSSSSPGAAAFGSLTLEREHLV
ncbi:MAG: galactokinase [Armatimonadota bacterium]